MNLGRTTVMLVCALGLTAASANAITLQWINGNFSLGDAGWNVGVDTAIEDHGADGDIEAVLTGCGGGDFRLSRGLSKLAVPAATPFSFDVEFGAMSFYSFRMVLVNAEDPEPYVNNLFYNDPSGTLVVDWFDDDVLAWQSNTVPLAGHTVLDPVDAIAFNIDGWADMTPEERTAELGTYVHASLVVYGCASGAVATLDNFAWEL